MSAEIKIQNNQIVLLIHGLSRTYQSMRKLGDFLQSHGYQAIGYDYDSHKHNINQHGLHLRDTIVELMQQYPDKQISFVTHSLGGIVAREALNHLAAEQLERCEHLIMLAPPSRGSLMARIVYACFPFLASFVKPLAELGTNRDAYVHRVGVPGKIKIGVIAGKFDAKTPPYTTHLDGENDFILINCTHTFIMNHAKSRMAILNFLGGGKFLA